MPRSKRSKVVSLTKTDKKGRAKKEALVADIRANVDKWRYVWLFEVGQMRNSHLKTVRREWKDSGRIFFGKKSVMAHALGSDAEHEHMPGLSKLATHLKDQVGLFFTDSQPQEVLDWFKDFQKPDFARAGNIASREVILPAGPILMVQDPPEPFPHSMEPQLRKLGLSTSLTKGVPTLQTPHAICKAGDKLTSEQAQLLKLTNELMVVFRVSMRAQWDKTTGSITPVEAAIDGPLAATEHEDELDEGDSD